MKKRLCFILILALCVSLLCVGVAAANIEDWEDVVPEAPTTSGTWTDSNNYDTSWYNDDSTSFTLNDAADLAGLAVIVNGLNEQVEDNFDGKTVKLASNGSFNMSEHKWVPIAAFAGTFDGQNATISGLCVTGDGYTGLFSYSGATIKNVNLTDAYLSSTGSSVGGIIGDARTGAKIENCTVSGTILYSGPETDARNSSVGGVVGGIDSSSASNVTITGCKFISGLVYSKTVVGNYTTGGIGGIVGEANNSTISNCTNNGTVCTTAISNNAGGIAGRIEDSTVTECSNTGDVKAGAGIANHGVGGIVGQVYVDQKESNKITECTNTGNITAVGSSSAGYAGGIVGKLLGNTSGNSGTIESCYNSGKILMQSSTQCGIGGLVGISEANLTIKASSNTGTILSAQSGNSLKLGGLVGSTSGVLTLTQSYNAGSVNIPSSTGYAGGLIGQAAHPTSHQVENCYNVGSVTGGTAGGLIGSLSANSSGGRTVSISCSYNAGTVNNGAGSTIVGQTSSYVTLTVADNCTYLDTSGTDGHGQSETANQMTEDSSWAENLGLDRTVWEKTNNPTAGSDEKLMGNLPVLTNNEQNPAPQIERTQKLDQSGFAITGKPTETIYVDNSGFDLDTTGGNDGGRVTWSSSNDSIATVDINGKVTIKGVGYVTITATKAGNDTYNSASAGYSFTVCGRPITEVTILNLEAPVQGAKPIQHVDVPEDAHYVVLTSAGIGGPSTLDVIWREQGTDEIVKTTFEQNKTYTVQMCLKCDEHYSFADEVTVRLFNMQESAYSSITVEEDPSFDDRLIITVTFNPTSHIHNWDTANWDSNETHHWHNCLDADCPLKNPEGMDGYAEHVDADHDDLCDVCGYDMYVPPVNIPDTYDIELIVGEGGKAKTNLSNASAGTTITVTATPDNGYELAYITVDGKRIDGTTFKMPDHDVTVRVYFTNGGFPFTDVASGAWYYDAVSYVYANGLMDGTSATTFEPNANMTRAMLVTILWRMEGEPVVNYIMPFTDVDGGAWYAEAVRWASSEGIVEGVSDTSFAPNAEITREQLAAILWRYAGEPATAANLAGYADGASVSAYAVDAMRWCVEHGIITGTTAATLEPQGTATRAQAAAMLMRFAENLK